MKQFALRLCVSAGAAMMVACGGGGGSGNDNAIAKPAGASATGEGAYAGTIVSGTPVNHMLMLRLEDDAVWTMYGIQTGATFAVLGFTQGTSTHSGSTFTSSVKDFYFVPPQSATATGSFTADRHITGTQTREGGTTATSFTADPIPSTDFDYETPANLADITGQWSMQFLGTGAAASVHVSSTGAIGGTSSGCTFSGTVQPRASGKNVFNVSVQFDAHCGTSANQSMQGVAVSYVMPGGQRRLIMAATNADRTAGAGWVGVPSLAATVVGQITRPAAAEAI